MPFYYDPRAGMNAALDINTPKGREAAADQQRATDLVFKNSAAHSFIHTAMDDAAAVDGFIVKDGIAVGVAEIKSRYDMNYAQLMMERDGEWLLTHQKLLDLQRVSQLLRLPGYGFIYLKQDEMVLAVQLTNSNGDIVCKYRVENTATQRTINGGTAHRDNAFIDVSKSRIYR